MIVGGGAAGLVAALTLEAAGHAPLLLEREAEIGGRLRTDEVDGFRLDRGFQVLLSEYPEVKRYLDLDALRVNSFRPGGHVHMRQQHFRFADPLREPAQLFRSALSPVGTLNDKIRLAQLGLKLMRISPEDCFQGYTQQTTIDFIWKYGFSEQIVERFFRPFFGGVFLEQKLETPAAMFRFVLKMFAQGSAVLPAEGIQAVADQLGSKLTRTEIRTGTSVKRISGDEVILEDDSRIAARAVVVACAPHPFFPQLAGSGTEYKSTSNLYFYSTRRLKENRLINLVVDPTSTINTYCVIDEVAPTYKLHNQGGSLISVSLKECPDTDSVAQAEQDLLRHTRLPNDALSFLKQYDIPHALPRLDAVAYTTNATQTRLIDRVFLAGDQQLNGSLDAAMRSGRLAAEGALRT